MIVVFTEVKGFGLAGDSFAGVVLEFTAIIRFGHDPSLDAENRIFINFCSIGAIFAGPGQFLSEEHNIDLAVLVRLLYTNYRRNATVFSYFQQTDATNQYSRD